MTIYRYEEIVCPDCGATNEVMVWSTINAQVSPEARKALLNGEINIVACCQCKNRILLGRPLLYHDMQIGYMAWYFPLSSVQDGTIFNSIDPSAQVRGIENYPECDYAASIHLVFDMDELVRYVRFRDVLAEEMKRSQG
jgi:ssDNA-binding Zn-finger/Zn-ribbon topoisomerase 1